MDDRVCVVSQLRDQSATATQPRGRRPGRPPTGSEDKRERILREAFSVFSQQGYEATSLGDVARAADISKAGLLHHFGSKEGLFSAVLERRDQEDLRTAEEWEGSVWQLLEWWVDVVARNSTRPGMVGLYTAMLAGVLSADGPAHPWVHKHFTSAVQRLDDALEAGKESGLVKPDAPSRQIARSVVAMSDGIQLQWLCARADGIADGAEDLTVPDHAGVPLDMAAQMRMFVDTIRARWAVEPDGVA